MSTILPHTITWSRNTVHGMQRSHRQSHRRHPMTDEIPEALAVLDLSRGVLVQAFFLAANAAEINPQEADLAIQKYDKVRRVIAELIEAAKEMESDAAILGMGCRRMNAALAAVEKLP